MWTVPLQIQNKPSPRAPPSQNSCSLNPKRGWLDTHSPSARAEGRWEELRTQAQRAAGRETHSLHPSPTTRGQLGDCPACPHRSRTQAPSRSPAVCRDCTSCWRGVAQKIRAPVWGSFVHVEEICSQQGRPAAAAVQPLSHV